MNFKIFLLGIMINILPIAVFSQLCSDTIMLSTDFDFVVRNPDVEVGWYPEWLDFTEGENRLPMSLPTMNKLLNPYMKFNLPSSMHEGPWASDVSNFSGPKPNNVQAQYFHVLEKGEKFSGMCPVFEFIDDSTFVTLSFGRASTTLLLIRVTDSIKLLDAIDIPGRGNNVWELMGKKKRERIFHNTAGGAYSYLSGHNHIYIPGIHNNILCVEIKNEKFVNNTVKSSNIRNQIAKGNLVDRQLLEQDRMNLLTAIMPDMKGNVWFTSRHGIVGLLHRNDLTEDGCWKVYATYIGKQAAIEKINTHFTTAFSEENISSYEKFEQLTDQALETFKSTFMGDENTREEIQNSFSIGHDGVYIVTNYALYKLRFNDEKKTIELDPKWVNSYKTGELIYDNDHMIKPGQLNNGSGTTPTLIDDRFVAICDNDSKQVNLCVFSQETGELIFKHKLFNDNGAAVENSVVAYGNSIIVGNTYGYEDVFEENPTPGGIMRFDFNEEKNIYEVVPNWPLSGTYDCKTATPKLSTASGMIYVYNRSDIDKNGHHDWQITAIDFRTGLRVFYLMPYFEKGEFDDNINFLLKWGSLGSKNYEQKAFNNIWATYTFGPGNSFYIGTYRGFLRVYSE